jgi:hypothetical protein
MADKGIGEAFLTPHEIVYVATLMDAQMDGAIPCVGGGEAKARSGTWPKCKLGPTSFWPPAAPFPSQHARLHARRPDNHHPPLIFLRVRASLTSFFVTVTRCVSCRRF